MKKAFLILSLLVGICAVLGIVAVVGLYHWASRDLPGFTRIADYRPALTTTVLARDGSVLGTFYRENRFLISLSDMPKILPQAFLAAEDAEFYQHEGVNPLAIFRAFLVNLQSG
ncbi:MAG: transglycosylase domain-containing protein, partial [Bilophila sp.]